MTDQTYHVNLTIQQTESHNISMVTTRLWPELLQFTRSLLFRTPIQGKVAHGMFLTVIANTAIIVEGFVTDVLIEHLQGQTLSFSNNRHFDPERASWRTKVDAFERVFGKRVGDFSQYSAVEALFLLRNNILHGRSHEEHSAIDRITGEKSKVKSENCRYESVRLYLIQNNLIRETDTLSNAHVFWNAKTAVFLFTMAESFMSSVLNMENLKNKSGLLSEFQVAVKS